MSLCVCARGLLTHFTPRLTLYQTRSQTDARCIPERRERWRRLFLVTETFLLAETLSLGTGFETAALVRRRERRGRRERREGDAWALSRRGDPAPL